MNRRRSPRIGISLIETIACVTIIATMATSIVGIMQNSVRVAAASRGVVGAPAEARHTLRFVSDQFRRWDRTDGISQIRGNTVHTGTHQYTFQRVASSTKVGNDLVLIDSLGGETLYVSGSLVNFSLIPIPTQTNPVGVEIRLQLSVPIVQAASLRPQQRVADVSTSVCFPPQLRSKP